MPLVWSAEGGSALLWRLQAPGKLPAPDSALLSSHPQSQPCPSSLSLAIGQHHHFQSLFNFSTPVLLWGGLFTSELWDGLSRHKAPYGWQGLSRQGNPLSAPPLPAPASHPSPPSPRPAILTASATWTFSPPVPSCVLPPLSPPSMHLGLRQGAEGVPTHQSHHPGVPWHESVYSLTGIEDRLVVLRSPVYGSCCGQATLQGPAVLS